MATLQERNGRFRMLFVFNHRRETVTLGPVTRAEAEAKVAQVDYLVMRLKQGLLTPIPGIDIVTFIQS